MPYGRSGSGKGAKAAPEDLDRVLVGGEHARCPVYRSRPVAAMKLATAPPVATGPEGGSGKNGIDGIPPTLYP